VSPGALPASIASCARTGSLDCMVWAQEVAQDVVVDRVAGTVLTDVGVRPLIATSGGYGRGLIRNISRASVLANCAYGAPFIFGYLGEGTVACSWSAGQAANTCALPAGSIDEAATTVATVAEHQNVAASDDTTFRRAIRTHCGLTDAAILHAHWEVGGTWILSPRRCASRHCCAGGRMAT